MYASTMQIFLDELSNRHQDELILLIMDGAPSHHAGAGKLRMPHNIRPVFQPPYSPEVNPTENIWDEIREKFFRNCAFENMKAVEDQLVSGLQWIESRPEQMKSLTCFPWIKNGLDCIA
jgi:transposase